MIPPADPALPPRTDINLRALERAALLAMGLVALVFLRNPGTSDLRLFWVPLYEDMRGLNAVVAYQQTAQDYPPLSHVILQCSARIGEAFGWDVLTGMKVGLLFFSLLAV